MEVKNYLPKRIRDRVVRVDVDADFDYDKKSKRSTLFCHT